MIGDAQALAAALGAEAEQERRGAVEVITAAGYRAAAILAEVQAQATELTDTSRQRFEAAMASRRRAEAKAAETLSEAERRTAGLIQAGREQLAVALALAEQQGQEQRGQERQDAGDVRGGHDDPAPAPSQENGAPGGVAAVGGPRSGTDGG